ncbi:hypothetical protein JCM8547_001783 [Rhodosporidiobolus lusitaniae]
MLSRIGSRVTQDRSAVSPSSAPTATLSPSDRQQRRLSRLTPSEFDSILDSSTTKHLDTSRDESQLGVALDVPSSPSFSSSPSHSPELGRKVPRSPRGAAVPPPFLSPEPTTPDAVKRRSMFRSVGNQSSPDLSSLLKKAREGSGRIGAVPGEEEEVLEEQENGEGAGGAFDDADEGPTSPSSPPRPSRNRAQTSPTITRTSPRPSNGNGASPPLPPGPPQSSQLSVPSLASTSAGGAGATDSRESTVASRASSGKPRLSSISTFSTGSYVHVGPQSAGPVARGGSQAEAGGGRVKGIMIGANASVTSLGAGIGFDFSPRRKKSDAGEDEGKLSLAGTMRKTSRFFRKFGGGGSSSNKGIGDSPTTAYDSTFSPSSSAPPVPAIPSSYSRPTTSSGHPESSRGREDSVDISISSPQSSPPLPRQPSPAATRTSHSHKMTRDTSQNSLAPSEQSALSSHSHQTSSPTKSARRRSLSLNSVLHPLQHHAQTPQTAHHPDPSSTTISRSRRPSASPRTAEEDDQLRRELRQWRLGVDGVLGMGAGGTPSPNASPAVGGGRGTPGRYGVGVDSSPTLTRTRMASGGERRPSLPEGKALPSLPPMQDPPSPQLGNEALTALQMRSQSLPTSSLLPAPPPLHSFLPSSTSPSEGTVSPAPSDATLPALAPPVPHPSVSSALGTSKRHSIADPEMALGLGLGLAPIEEGMHSREGSSAASPVGTPVRGGAGEAGEGGEGTPTATSNKTPTVVAHAPSPTSASSPPALPSSANGNGNGKSSNQRGGVTRASIVGYPTTSTSSASAAPSPLRSLPASATASTSSFASLSSLPHSLSSHPPSSLPFATKKSKKQREEEEHAAMSQEVLEEKARVLAGKVWEGDEGFLERRKVAEWLGSAGRLNVAALKHYIDNFEFAGLRLDVAFRRLCTKLYLKAETQQVDRILEQFSRKYFEDNPRTVYGSADVVHAVSYSLLLLNTDLHVVDTTSRMTRQQFIRNTVEAIKAQTGDGDEVITTPPLHSASSGAALLFGTSSRATSASASPRPDGEGDATSVFGSADANASRRSVDRPKTAASVASVRSTSNQGAKDSPSSSTLNLPGSPALSRTPIAATLHADSPSKPPPTQPQRSESLATVNSTLSSRSLEANLQATLKEMYNAIKSQPIYQSSSGSALHLPSSSSEPGASRPSLNLTPGTSPYATWSGINRSASRRSGPNGASSNASLGSLGSGGSSSYKRSSIRGMGAFLGAGGGAGSSSLELTRTSSPTPSTATSLSDEHWSNAFGSPSSHHSSSLHHAVPTIGFASSLSHTIIREQREDAETSSVKSLLSVSSAELALLGAPWAKEGMLTRKHYWETAGKRARDKNWVGAFVVVSAGELKMFKFGAGGGGMSSGMGGLGGGDWTSNASSVGSISLIHALCSAMPAPGYSRDRPHCFVLTLPNGGSYFFQAGTPDLVAEWVATCNYWSARLSKEPLSGGVSNMEYGWNRAEPVAREENGEVDGGDDYEEIASIRSGHSRVSHAGSAFSYGGASSSGGGSSTHANDRIHINEWKPPQVPLTPSNMPEEQQLEALRRHAEIVKAELAHHNVLRNPMIRLYSSRSSNGTKALANWERKSQHLLTESVKWTTYIDALASAIRLRSLQRGKKEVEAMLEQADDDEEDEEDDDELAARLSPYDEGPVPVAVKVVGGEKDAEKKQDPPPAVVVVDDSDVDADKLQSQISVATETTTGEEFFDSTADTPPPT